MRSNINGRGLFVSIALTLILGGCKSATQTPPTVVEAPPKPPSREALGAATVAALRSGKTTPLLDAALTGPVTVTTLGSGETDVLKVEKLANQAAFAGWLAKNQPCFDPKTAIEDPECLAPNGLKVQGEPRCADECCTFYKEGWTELMLMHASVYLDTVCTDATGTVLKEITLVDGG